MLFALFMPECLHGNSSTFITRIVGSKNTASSILFDSAIPHVSSTVLHFFEHYIEIAKCSSILFDSAIPHVSSTVLHFLKHYIEIAKCFMWTYLKSCFMFVCLEDCQGVGFYLGSCLNTWLDKFKLFLNVNLNGNCDFSYPRMNTNISKTNLRPIVNHNSIFLYFSNGL